MNPGHALAEIALLLVVAKSAAEVASRAGFPVVVAEILLGLVFGPSLLGLFDPSSQVLVVLAELGIILLLFRVGLETDLEEVRKVGRVALGVMSIGVLASFVLVFGVALGLGEEPATSAFIAAALTATGVGVAARVFEELNAIRSSVARTVLAAAMADDVVGLIILTVVVGLVESGSVSLGVIGTTTGMAFGFLLIGGALAIALAPRLLRIVHLHQREPQTLVVVALGLAVLTSELAVMAGLASIVGAFIAGLAIGRGGHGHQVQAGLEPVAQLFIPIFFLRIGIDTDAASFLEPSVSLLAVALLAAATVGKLLAGLAVWGSGSRLAVGLGMVPRGEVVLLFAGIGKAQELLTEDLYAAVVLVVLGTALLVPPLLRRALNNSHDAGPSEIDLREYDTENVQVA